LPVEAEAEVIMVVVEEPEVLDLHFQEEQN